MSILDDFQIEQELKILYDQKTTFHKNCNKNQYKAIKEIKDSPYLIVRQADKEGKVVVLDKDLYGTQVLQLLSQTHISIFDIRSYLSRLLSEGVALGAITSKISQYIDIEHPVVPIFHSLPRTH